MQLCAFCFFPPYLLKMIENTQIDKLINDKR